MTDWRSIPGFPGYEASSEGQIRPTKPRYKTGRGSVLKPWIVEQNGREAAYVTLCTPGLRSKQLVHRLVCLAFHGPPPEGKNDCCHKDHVSLNNVASNLRWDSHSNNMLEHWEQRAIQEQELLAELASSFVSPQDMDIPF